MSENVGDRWNILVILELHAGPRGFAELLAAVPEISLRAMTQSLRTLERNGLVTTYGNTRAQYRLTPLGRTMVAPLRALTSWARYHQPMIDKARTEFDRLARR